MEYTQEQIASHLDTCLSISGFFEGSNFNPRYDNATDNFDGAGISCGCLQWAAGPGSLSTFLKHCLHNMDEAKANAYFSEFGDSVVTNMSNMNGDQAKNYSLANFLDGAGKWLPNAKAAWKTFLVDEDVIKTQRQVAQDDILMKAYSLVSKFTPGEELNLRAIAFFFDIVVQSGGMKNSRGSVEPVKKENAGSYVKAVDEARAQGKQWTADRWANSTDEPISRWLLHYAYERAQLSLPQWRWNALARRGTIATRWGYVNSTKIDLTNKLP
jgi:hypothetical protein